MNGVSVDEDSVPIVRVRARVRMVWRRMSMERSFDPALFPAQHLQSDTHMNETYSKAKRPGEAARAQGRF